MAGQVVDGRVVAFDEGVNIRDVLGGDTRTRPGERSWPLDEVTLLAPVPSPRAIYGISLNYAGHARETGRERPERPIVFTKVPGAVTAPGGPIRCPEVVRRLDYEGELTVVIGAGGAIGG